MTDTTKTPENAGDAADKSTDMPSETNVADQNDPKGAEPEGQNANPAADDGAPPKDGDEEAPKAYVPDGMPEHLIGETDQETIDKALKAYKGARDELAKKYNIPERIDDYQIEFSDEEKEKFLSPDEDGNDPVFNALRESAFKNGIPAEKAAAWARDLFEMVHSDIDDKVQDKTESTVDAKFEKIGGPEKAEPIKKANEAWIQGLQNQGIIDEDDAAEMSLLTQYGEGLRWLDKVRTAVAGEKPIPADLSGDTGGGETLSEAKLTEMMRDPRYWKSKDPDYIKQVEAGFKKLYGGEKVA